MEYGLNHFWPSTIQLSKIKDNDLLSDLCQEILTSNYVYDPPSDFQSFDFLAQGSKNAKKFLKNEVIPAFDDYLNQVINVSLKSYKNYNCRSWLAGMKGGYFIPTHNHSGASLSAVFYLLSEETDKGGELEIMDPRTNANRGYDENFKKLFDKKTLLPSTGDIVIFPSFLYHYTLPFTGSMRLAMPVDLYLQLD